MISDNFQEVLKELRTILSQVKGVQNIGEDFTLNYLILVDNQENKENAKKVCDTLTMQAKSNFNIALDIYVLTKEEFEEAKKKGMSPTFVS